MFNESHITKKLKEYLAGLKSELGDSFYFQKMSDRFTDGIPDYYILYRGHSLWLELKATRQRPKPIQIHVLKRLARAGAVSEWTDNFEDAKICVSEFINKINSL